MDILTNKQYLQYDYISRYSSFPVYYNKEDKKWIYSLTKHLNNATAYVLHEISSRDTLDYLSLKYYGRPDLYWVIADYNRINDPVKDIEVTYDVDDDYEAINKMKKVHEEAMEQRYNDYVKEEKEAKDEALRQRELIEESNQKYEQQMIENAHLYQDISNMSNVEIIGNDNQNDVKTLKK